MLEKQLLELTAEYMNSDEQNDTLAGLGLAPNRSKDVIAAEYGRVLKEFLAP